MLEVTCEELGADAICYSTRERINSGEAKIDKLREVCPRAFEPNAAVVGITDTSYGEDDCWAEYFSCVVDINSHSPFPPIVSQTARAEEIHSALVLTREEQRQRTDGESGYLDRRRAQVGKREYVELDRDSLHSLLHDMVCKVSTLAARGKSAHLRRQLRHRDGVGSLAHSARSATRIATYTRRWFLLGQLADDSAKASLSFGLCTRKVAPLSCTHDRKPSVFGRSAHRSGDGLRSPVAPHGTVRAPSESG